MGCCIMKLPHINNISFCLFFQDVGLVLLAILAVTGGIYFLFYAYMTSPAIEKHKEG